MQRLEVSGAVRPIYGSLGVKRLTNEMHFLKYCFTPLNGELNPICHLLALLGAHHFFHVSGLRVNLIILFFYMFRTSCVHHQED